MTTETTQTLIGRLQGWWPQLDDDDRTALALRNFIFDICSPNGGGHGGSTIVMVNQYTNLRPIRILPGVSAPLKNCAEKDLDWMIARANSEGEYAGQGGTTHDGTPYTVANEVAVFTRVGIERTMRFAFDVARGRPRKKLTMVTKSNAQRYGLVLWDKVFYDLAKEYPDVKIEKMLIDLAAALTGSIGVAASSSLDPTRKNPILFKPIHGSAPDITGLGVANPIGTFWSAAEMLRWLGEGAADDLLMGAVETVTAARLKTKDLWGSSSFAQVTDAVISELRTSYSKVCAMS